jgi:hypothetical protein
VETNQISVILQDGDRKHTLTFVQRENAILLMRDGKAGPVATLTVATMTKDVMDAEGDYHTKFTDDFVIAFVAADPVGKRDCSCMAMQD